MNAINRETGVYVYVDNFVCHFPISGATRVYLALDLSRLPTWVSVLLSQTIDATCVRKTMRCTGSLADERSERS